MQHISFESGRALEKYPKILVVLDGPAISFANVVVKMSKLPVPVCELRAIAVRVHTSALAAVMCDSNPLLRARCVLGESTDAE